jgi:hypothetical protein
MSKRLFVMLKNTFIFQDILSWLKAHIPPALEHNWGKYDAIKKAFYLTALERLDGDYLEFGIFTGSSFVCAIRSHRQMRGVGDVKTRFFGFDSFAGFGEVKKEDRHPFYLDDTFAINERKVIRFIMRRAKKEHVRIIKGYFEKTLQGRSCGGIGVKRIRILFIDCDMKRPAELALEFSRPGIQAGTIIILDDFYSYRGDSTKGVAGAFYGFLRKDRRIKVRELYDYGIVGKAFIVEKA